MVMKGLIPLAEGNVACFTEPHYQQWLYKDGTYLYIDKKKNEMEP